MTLYRAEKDNIGFYIQPNMLSAFQAQGYKITKLEEVVVEDAAAEEEAIMESSTSDSENQ